MKCWRNLLKLDIVWRVVSRCFTLNGRQGVGGSNMTYGGNYADSVGDRVKIFMTTCIILVDKSGVPSDGLGIKLHMYGT